MIGYKISVEKALQIVLLSQENDKSLLLGIFASTTFSCYLKLQCCYSVFEIGKLMW